MKITANDIKITKKQIEYIEILAIDLELSRRQRNGLIALELQKPVRFIDELTKDEGSKIISYFKELKLSKQDRDKQLNILDLNDEV